MGLKSADIFRSPDLLIRHVTCCPGHHELSGIERCRNKTKSFIPVVGLMDIGTLEAYRRAVSAEPRSNEAVQTLPIHTAFNTAGRSGPRFASPDVMKRRSV
jgi:hypothetical protein